jgi:flagellar hook-associated protein 2
MISSIASSLGFGSGIDTAALIEDLATASRSPKIQRLEAQQRTNQAKISALGQARSDLNSFTNSLNDVVKTGSLRSQPSVSDANALSAIATSTALPKTLSAEVEINQLARSQTIYSDYSATSTAAIGQGGLTLSVGGQSYAIVIGAGNDSLDGLATAINASGSGVSAQVATDANGSRLVLKGASGAANSFTLTSDAGSDPQLLRYSHGAAGSLMSVGQTAADALLKVDGIAYARPTNQISDIISGVDLTLKKAAPGVLQSIGMTRPTDAIKQTIDDFVSVFNDMKASLKEARTATGGDYALRKIDQQISSLINRSVTSHSSINSLNDIGIGTNKDGSIRVDAAKLNALLLSDPEAVEAIFNPPRDATHTEASDPGISMVLTQIRDDAVSENGLLDSLSNRFKKESDAISKNKERTETRESVYRLRLEKQFGSMDARIGALKATQSYLEQQIKLWNSGQ